MAAPQGNRNARKEATRVAACLSIADEKGKPQRRAWAVACLREKEIEHPTPEQISRFVKDWCYERIDEAINAQN